MPYVRGMNTDLMGPPGFQSAFQKRRMIAECFKNRKACYSMPSSLEQDSLPLSIGLVTCQHRRDLYHGGRFETYAWHAAQPRITDIWRSVTYRKIASVDRVI